MKGFKLGFDRWLKKSEVGKAYLDERAGKIRLGKEMALKQEKENLKMQNSQKEILKDLIKSERICFVNGIKQIDKIFHCSGEIDKKQCSKEWDIIDILYFSKNQPPQIGISLGLDRQAILDFLYENLIVRHITCEFCGTKYSLSNRKG